MHYFKSTLTCLKNQFLLYIIRLQYSVVTKYFCACIAADYSCVLYTNCFCKYNTFTVLCCLLSIFVPIFQLITISCDIQQCTNCFCIILTKFPCLSSSWSQWVWCCVNAARWPCCTNSSSPAAFTGKCRLSPARYPSEWTEP